MHSRIMELATGNKKNRVPSGIVISSEEQP
jgi:hypothetical protein